MNETRPSQLFDVDNSFIQSGINFDSPTTCTEEEMLKNFPTRDEAVYKLLNISRVAASAKIPILITGESGSGKETLSKAIHIAGGKNRGKMMVANCSNLPQHFFEMDLSQRQGEYSRSLECSTLMMDEITSLDNNMQIKLLKILRDQDLNKGSIKRGTLADSRIIACTVKNLQDEVSAQKFRQDLFFKLNGLSLEIPALRKRPLDIDYYSELFIKEFCNQFSKNVQLSPTAKQALRTYSWPGNVRELRSVIQRSVLLSTTDYIGVEELHMIKANSRTEVALSDSLPQITLRELEQRMILQTLRRMNGNRTHTAKVLGISLRALRYKLNELVDCGFEVEGKNI
jgi:DNA-binding NtrC family response regulator